MQVIEPVHIEAAMEGGERFNPESNDEYRRSYENLLILCYPHHIETNDVEEYPVNRLAQMKNKHERLFEESDFKIDEVELVKLSNEMEKFWNVIERLNKIDHIFSNSGLAMEVNSNNNFFDVLANAYDAVNGIQNMLESLHASDEALKQDFDALLIKKGIAKELFDGIPCNENPFENRNWELHNLGTPNWLQRLRIDLAHIEVRYIEEYLKTNSNDLDVKVRFEKAKRLLKEFAKTTIHID